MESTDICHVRAPHDWSAGTQHGHASMSETDPQGTKMQYYSCYTGTGTGRGGRNRKGQIGLVS